MKAILLVSREAKTIDVVGPDEITNDTDRVKDINDYDSTTDEVGVRDISGVEVADIDNEREARENENVDFRVSKDPE